MLLSISSGIKTNDHWAIRIQIGLSGHIYQRITYIYVNYHDLPTISQNLVWTRIVWMEVGVYWSYQGVLYTIVSCMKKRFQKSVGPSVSVCLTVCLPFRCNASKNPDSSFSISSRILSRVKGLDVIHTLFIGIQSYTIQKARQKIWKTTLFLALLRYWW